MSAVGLGDRLGDNRLEAIAGRGTTGVVYRATQVGLERTVAVKVICSALAADPAFRERFTREVRLLAAVDHPHVIPIHQVGEADGRPFVSMRWIDGGDLGGEIATRGLDRDRALSILGQIAEALDAAHARGLVHRDIRPANVLLEGRSDGEHAYLTDFGAGRIGDPGDPAGQASEYAAPEILAGADPDPRSDLYALGSVLFEALAATQPPLRDTPALNAVRARALAGDPRDRYPTGRRLIDAARDALASDTSRAAPPPDHRDLEAPAPAAGADSARALAGRTASRPALGLLAAVVGVAVAIAGGVVAGSSDSPRAPQRPKSSNAPAAQVTRVPLGAKGLGPVVTGPGRVYVGDEMGRALFVVDSVAHRKIARVKLPGEPDQLVLDPRHRRLWVGLTSGRLVTVELPSNRLRGRPLQLPIKPDDMLFVGGRFVIAQHDPLELVRVDPDRRRLAGRVVKSRSSSLGVIRDGTSILALVAGFKQGFIRYDARLHQTAQQPIDADLPGDVAVVGGSLWVTDFGLARVHRLSRSTGRRSAPPISVGRNPSAIAADGTSLWVTNKGDSTVTRIDRGTGRPVGPPVPTGPFGGRIAARAGGGAWVPGGTNLLELTPPGGL